MKTVLALQSFSVWQFACHRQLRTSCARLYYYCHIVRGVSGDNLLRARPGAQADDSEEQVCLCTPAKRHRQRDDLAGAERIGRDPHAIRARARFIEDQ